MVVDSDGQGLSGVRVFIPNTAVETTTNQKGEYNLVNIPSGTYSLLATKPGYRMEGFPVDSQAIQTGVEQVTPSGTEVGLVLAQLSSVHVTVQVHRGKVQAPQIRLTPYQGGANDVTVVSITPGANANLQRGANHTLQLDLHYSLPASPNGIVVATLLFGSRGLGTDHVMVEEPRGTVRLSIPFTVPNAESVTLQVGLMDENGLLAVTSQSLFNIQGYTQPMAPKLQLDSADSSGVVLSWSGAMENFEALQIWRAKIPFTDVLPSDAELRATITDPTITSFADTEFTVGEAFYYAAHLKTTDGGIVTGTKGDVLFVTTFGTPPVSTNLGLNSTDSLVYSSSLDRLYVLQGLNVTVLSTSTGQETGNLRLACRTRQPILSADSLELYYLCPDSQELAVTRLANGNTRKISISGLTEAATIAYDTHKHTLYITTGNAINGWDTLAVDPASGHRELIGIPSQAGLRVVPRARLLIAKESYSDTSVTFYDLDTLEVLHELPPGSGGVPNVRYDGDRKSVV